MSDKVKLSAEVEHIIFFRDNWGIIKCNVKQIIKGELSEINWEILPVIFKGNMPQPVEGCTYIIVASYAPDSRYGDQYLIDAMYAPIDFDDSDEIGKKKYLLSIFTAGQVEAMFEALNDPFKALKNNDKKELVKIKGCGLKTADVWVRRFDSNYKRAKIYIELEDYGLTDKMIDSLVRTYKSPDLVIDKVKNNPYVLVNEVNGIGWKKADDIAIKGGIDPLGALRVSEFIKYYLFQCGEQGMSYVEPDMLLGAILDNVGEDVSDTVITEALGMLDLWHNEEKTRIGIKYYRELEEKIAKELIRIRDAESDFTYDNWKDRIKELEKEQGWEFTDEQMRGIEAALKNNIVIIHAPAGAGKSSLVSGVLAALPSYSHVMCALSGRASARLAELTGEEGFTIHRLLGFPKGEKAYQDFIYHQDNKLCYEIYIVDEISMVDARLFYYLIRAIPSGSKLIMLGDDAQLEAIGCGNIAFDLIHSPEIIDVPLTKIHRQAAKSAIITESLAIRSGQQIVNKNWFGKETRGELQDLQIECYGDSSNSYYKVMEQFQRLRAQKDFNIMETQILVPVKKRGDANTFNLNNDIQELYNPASKNKREEAVMTISSGLHIFREGDKVINTVNNYKTDPVVYNGNIGIFKRFDMMIDEDGYEEDCMVINFRGIGTVKIPKQYWNYLDLAYAITYHKFQGDQADYIIMNLDFNSYSLLTRQLIYTGITRAKKKCFLIAQTSALRYGTAQEAVSQKQTHLQDCLYELTHPKLVF